MSLPIAIETQDQQKVFVIFVIASDLSMGIEGGFFRDAVFYRPDFSHTGPPRLVLLGLGR
jgi:hypothetical protein